MEGAGESTLRAKYLDWCSARLAERFLDLSPEEIYALARPEASEQGGSGEGLSGEPPLAESPAREEAAGSVPATGESGRPPPLPHPEDDSYRMLVQRVTEALLKRTSLPTFEQWAEAYRERPERFDAELLGFWKDVVGEEPNEAEGD